MQNRVETLSYTDTIVQVVSIITSCGVRLSYQFCAMQGSLPAKQGIKIASSAATRKLADADSARRTSK